MAKVSVIVPVYNPPEEYFEACCKSILGQSFQDFEVILIDNASTGKNSTIIEKYCKLDNRFKSYKFPKNCGFSGACNKGLELASSDYVQIVDSDDILEKNALEKEFQCIKNTQADVIIFEHQLYDCKQDVVKKVTSSAPLYIAKEFKLDVSTRWLLYGSLTAWNKVFSLKFLKENNLRFDTDISVAAPDVLMSIKSLVLAKKISYIKSTLYTYRINLPNNVMANLKKKKSKLYDSVFYFVKKIDNFVINQNIDESLLPYILKVNFDVLFMNFKIVHIKNKFDFYRKLQDFLKNTDKNIYKKSYLKLTGYYEDYKSVIYCPFLIFLLKEAIYRHIKTENVERINLFGFNIYKKTYKNGFIRRRYCGIIRTKEIDMNTYADYIISTVTKKICKYIDTKLSIKNKKDQIKERDYSDNYR